MNTTEHLRRHAHRWTDARLWEANTVQNRPDSLAGSTVRAALGITPADIEAWAYAFGDIIAKPCCDAPCWIDPEGVVVYHRISCPEVSL